MGFVVAIQSVPGQRRGAANPELIARRHSIEKELQSVAIIERKLMVAMRDGKRMAADLYRPKDTSKKYPTI
jgi:predicted acyl esterase